MQKLLPYSNSSKVNPWFRRLYQERENCKIQGDFSNSNISQNTAVCEADKPLTDSEKIRIDIYGYNMIKAMYALRYGLQDVIGKTNLFLRDKATVGMIRNKLQNIRIPSSDNALDSSTPDLEPFDKNLDGTGGYEVFCLTYSNKAVNYTSIYTFTKQDGEDKISKTRLNSAQFYVGDGENEEDVTILEVRHCEEGCLCPNDADTAIILLSVALSLVSAIMAVFLIRTMWKKYGGKKGRCKIERLRKRYINSAQLLQNSASACKHNLKTLTEI